VATTPPEPVPPGIARDDPFYPLRGAVNAPGPRTPGGPPIYLGGQGPRGIRLAARTAAGWLQPGTHAGNVPYFSEKRSELLAALDAAGREPTGFDLVAQVGTGATPETRAAALDAAKASIGAGATHVILGMPAPLGPAGLDEVVRDCLLPLREATA
jgi:alkanesulfonate monooxygenase SsuD/methylene tetrahydromethanopterin reductase-like flavin-dependent oxidoreductase (luciferase family)